MGIREEETVVTWVEDVMALDWDAHSLPSVLDMLEKSWPLKVKLQMDVSIHTVGCSFDGERVQVAYSMQMPIVSVLVSVVQGYALASALGTVGMPKNAAERGLFHSHLMDFYLHLVMDKGSQHLGSVFRSLCVPWLMEYVEKQAAVEPEKLN